MGSNEATDLQTFDILPFEHEQITEDATVFELSDVDRLIPARYNKVSIIFKLTDEAEEREQFITHLRTGLQNALTNIPIIGARVLGKADGPALQRRSHEPLPLYVRRLESEPQCPSYAELASGKFNPKALAAITPLLFPPGADLDSFRADDGAPVVVLQANFIRGGWILLFVKHHFIGDGTVFDHTVALWAASTKAAMDGQPMPTFRPSLDRQYFNSSTTPGHAEVQELKKRVRALDFHPLTSAQQIYARQTRPIVGKAHFRIFHFPAAACARLKALCKPPDGDEVAFVSSYDCVCGLTWRAILRAMLPQLDAAGIERGPSTASKFLHPVGTRGRFDGRVPNTYLGNAFVMASAELDIDALLGSDGLAKAAREVRHSSSYVTESSVPDIARLMKGIQGREQARWILQPHNVLATSWNNVRVFSEYDFGWGLPTALRPLPPSYPGSVRILPADRIDGTSDGLMAHISLVQESMERLGADLEYREFGLAHE